MRCSRCAAWKKGPNIETVIATISADFEGAVAADVVIPRSSKGGPHQLIVTGTVTGTGGDAALKISGNSK